MPETGVQNLKARYIFPVLGPPIPDGVLSICGGRIAAVGKEALSGPVEDLGQAALLPGLINAHTHLEFSLLDRPIGQPGVSFCEWARLVVERFRPIPSPVEKRDDPRAAPSLRGLRDNGGTPESAVRSSSPASAVQAGLAELIRTGATAAADIVQPGFAGHLYSQIGMKAIAFLELRGPTRSRASQAIQHAQEHLEAWLDAVYGKPLPDGRGSVESPPISPEKRSKAVILPQPASPSAQAASPPEGRDDWYPPVAEAPMSRHIPWQLGLSPHAPYTVRPELLEAAVALAQSCRLPLAMHLAESLEEIQWLQTGQGPLRTLLEELGQWEAGLVEPPKRPLDYLRRLAQAERVLIIHGNYLDEEEWAFLAAHREQMAVVFCPRSHAHFGHRPYPLQEMLSWGVRVILGTDSRASAPDMNMLAELRWVAARFPSLPPERILELAALESARALGWGDELGALVPGRRADVIAVALPDRAGQTDPYELVFHSNLPIVAAWIAGQRVC